MHTYASRALLALTSTLVCFAANAAYPDKPVRLVVPYVAGSPADNAARQLGEGLSKRLGQTVIVENKAGANGMIGSEQVARAAPDGYTIMLGNMDTHAINPLLYRNIRYQPTTDFAPVALLGTMSTMLVASPAAPVTDGASLISHARREPGKVTYGSWGLGSVAHLWGSLLEDSAQIRLLHVPFQGSPAAMNALMGNQIDLMFMSPSLAVANAKNGKVRIIGSTASARLAKYPDVPTLAEQGFGNYAGTTWFAVFAPAKTPEAVLERLNTEVNAVLATPGMAEAASTLTMDMKPGSRQDLARVMAESREKWGAVITARNIAITD